MRSPLDETALLRRLVQPLGYTAVPGAGPCVTLGVGVGAVLALRDGASGRAPLHRFRRRDSRGGPRADGGAKEVDATMAVGPMPAGSAALAGTPAAKNENGELANTPGPKSWPRRSWRSVRRSRRDAISNALAELGFPAAPVHCTGGGWTQVLVKAWAPCDAGRRAQAASRRDSATALRVIRFNART